MKNLVRRGGIEGVETERGNKKKVVKRRGAGE